MIPRGARWRLAGDKPRNLLKNAAR
jgi:hypothetical protein